MQQLGHLRRFMQQPVLNVIGMLGAAGATKIGYAGGSNCDVPCDLPERDHPVGGASDTGVLGSRYDGTDRFDCIPVGDEIPPSVGHGRVKQTS
jgi:hypothetical protein